VEGDTPVARGAPDAPPAARQVHGHLKCAIHMTNRKIEGPLGKFSRSVAKLPKFEVTKPKVWARFGPQKRQEEQISAIRGKVLGGSDLRRVHSQPRQRLKITRHFKQGLNALFFFGLARKPVTHSDFRAIFNARRDADVASRALRPRCISSPSGIVGRETGSDAGRRPCGAGLRRLVHPHEPPAAARDVHPQAPGRWSSRTLAP
jgi:hypothetical protein